VRTFKKHIRDVHQEPFIDAQKMLKFHEMMLKEELFHESVHRRILKDLMYTEWAVTEEANSITSRLESSGDSYLQARIEDIWDIVHNILLSLSLSLSEYSAEIKMIGREHILVSQNLFLSEVMRARRFHAGGLVTKSNALISHAAILLKSLNIPSLGNVRDLEMNIKNGDEIIIDGINGHLIVRPTQGTLDVYHTLQRCILSGAHRREYNASENRTRDGTKVSLLENTTTPGR
jgi:phosphotransferase system enzyme I (PtsI)